MHQQIKASPDNTADNVRRIVNALAREGINIEAIAPDFDPPHVRVLVAHNDPFDPGDKNDTFNRALAALQDEGLQPEIKSSLPVMVPNKPAALKTVMDRLARQGYKVESVLVLPESGQQGAALVNFGVSRTTVEGWDAEADNVRELIENELSQLP
jgi:hypothetical protein